jgi:hypothetical protein
LTTWSRLHQDKQEGRGGNKRNRGENATPQLSVIINTRARREKDEGRDETGRGVTRPRNRGSGMIDRVDRSKGMETLMEHLKKKTRLTNEKFPSVKGECEI